MEDFEHKWEQVEHYFKNRFGKVPNMESMLYLIGINEYKGRTPKYKFSKEQKQDLMHVAVCMLLSRRGYYKFIDYDEEGWPHYQQEFIVEANNLEDQEQMLKEEIIAYFDLQEQV